MGIKFSRSCSHPYTSQQSSNSRFSTRAELTKKLSRQFSYFSDDYSSIEQVTNALRKAGLESSNLIVGIDFTKSNEWTGKKSFSGRSLHAMNVTNPYEQAISIIGRTLSPFDEDNLIPCFGFGDVSTHDQSVFSFFPENRPCNGFEEALSRYKEIVPHLRLAGPTSFAPIIEAAMDIVAESGCQYHVLLIIADGQVTRSCDTESGRLSPQEQSTVDAIVAASEFPLSIVLVGVGDGPWDMMKEFDDNIPDRAFDNFQFVNFTEIMSKNTATEQKEAAFSLAALMEIPSQFKAALSLKLINRRTERVASTRPFSPPIEFMRHDNTMPRYPHSTSFSQANYQQSSGTSLPPRARSMQPQQYRGESGSDIQVCPICMANPKNMAFNCGHQTCEECGEDLSTCPICRVEIKSRLRLY